MRPLNSILARSLILSILVAFSVVGVLYPTVRVELLAKTTIPSSVAGSWQDVLIVSALLITILSLKVRRGVDLVSFGIILIAASGVVSFAVALANDVPPKAMLYAARLTYLPVCFYIVARYAPLRLMHIRRLYVILFGVFVFAACMGLLFSFAVPDYWLNLVVMNSAGRDWGLDAIARVGGYRMTGTLLDPVTFGTISAWAVIFGVSMFKIGDAAGRNIILVTAILLCALGVVLSLTRGAWLICLIGWFISLLVSFRRRFVSSAVMLACTAVGIIFILSIYGGELYGLISRTWEKTITEANIQREEMWADAFDGFLRHPFGFGLGTVGHIGERFHEEFELGAPIITDGWYHKILAEGGVPLFISFCVFQIGTIVSLLKLIYRNDEPSLRAFRTACLAVFLGSSIQAVASNLWDLFFISHLLWMLVGLSTRRCCGGGGARCMEGVPKVSVWREHARMRG